MAFLVVISSPAKIRMLLLLSTTHSAPLRSTAIHSVARVSRAHSIFRFRPRSQISFDRKISGYQTQPLRQAAGEEGTLGRKEGTRSWWRVSRARKESKKFAILAWMESHENVIHFGAAMGARCTPIASCCLSWFGRFTSQTFPPSLSLPVGGVLSRKDNTEKLHRAQTRVESDTLEN